MFFRQEAKTILRQLQLSKEDYYLQEVSIQPVLFICVRKAIETNSCFLQKKLQPTNKTP